MTNHSERRKKCSENRIQKLILSSLQQNTHILSTTASQFKNAAT